MSLIKCMQKIQKQLTAEDKQELHKLTAVNIKKNMDGPAAERAAVETLLKEAAENKEYLTKEIKEQLKIEPSTKEERQAKKAEETPANAPIKVEAGEEPTGSPEARKESTTDKVLEAAGTHAERLFGPAGRQTVDNVAAVAKTLVGSLEFLHKKIDRIAPHMPSARTWFNETMKKEKTKNVIEQKFEVVSQLANQLSDKERLVVGDYMARSSLAQKWGHQPKDLKRTVEIDAAWKAQFDKLTPKQQELADTLFTVHDEITKIEQDLLEKNGATGIFAARGFLDGPYVHLARKGDYIAVLKSAEYLAAEKAKNKTLLKTLETQQKHYVVKAFDTPGAANRFALENKKDYAYHDASAKTPQLENRNTMNPQVLDRLRSAVKADGSMDPRMRASMEESLQSMYLSTLDANSARQAHNRRSGIEGWDEDVVATALKQGRAKASYIANVEHGARINDAFHAMQREIKHPETGKRVGQDDFNQLAAHHSHSLDYKATPIQDGVVAATSAWQLVTSLGYHLTNFTQPIMYSLPRLAADFGAGKYGDAWGHILDGYKLMGKISDNKGMTIELDRIKASHPELYEALSHASDMQLLDVGMTEDLKHFDRFNTGYKSLDGTSAVASRAIHKMRQVSSAVERWNRVSSGVASYNMARAEGRTPEQAKDYMMGILRDTQGDFSHTDAPLILKKLPKIVGQYRKFQLMAAAYYVNAYKQAFHGATPAEKAIGRRLLAFKLGHTAIASGIVGLPLANLVGMVVNAVTDGPDTNEVDTGSKELDQLLNKGVLSFLGVDTGAKLSEDKIFSIAPYAKFDLSSKSGLAETVMGYAGGPAGGLAGQMASGAGLIHQGDIYKGAEKFMPKGIASAMQGFRLANEGYTLKNGDVLVKPEDISAFGSMLTAVGLPAAEVTHIQEQANKQYTITKYYSDKTKELEHKYIKAYNDKDTSKMVELRAEWMGMQKEKDAHRKAFKDIPDVLKHQPLATMTNAPHKAMEREKKEQRQYGG